MELNLSYGFPAVVWFGNKTRSFQHLSGGGSPKNTFVLLFCCHGHLSKMSLPKKNLNFPTFSLWRGSFVEEGWVKEGGVTPGVSMETGKVD